MTADPPHALRLPPGAVLEVVQVRRGQPIPEGYEPVAWAPSHHDRHISGAAERLIYTETTMIDDLIADLRRDEGLRLKPYRCTAGRLTIGYGRNLDDRGISEAEAEEMLRNDVADVTADLDRALPWWRGLSAARRRALANMAFNLGISRLLGFRLMLAALQRGDYEEAARQALDSLWARQVGGRAQRIAKLIREGGSASHSIPSALL